jgi:hypothetical protein
MFQTKVVENLKTHNILCSVTPPPPRKSCRLWDNVETYGTVGQATNDIIWRMRFACWMTKAADTHSEYATCLLFPGNAACTDAPQCYVYTFIVSYVRLWYILSSKHWRWLCPWNFRSTYCSLNAAVAPPKNCLLELKNIWQVHLTIPAHLSLKTYPARCSYCRM